MGYLEEIWHRVIAVHLKGTFLCCKAVLPVMKARKSGRIIKVTYFLFVHRMEGA
jgi:3-oxoacyl-[acyl-carrier protein] reductase